MGGGIAISAIVAGLPVTLIDPNAEMLDQARARANKYLARQTDKERMTQAEAEEVLKRFSTAQGTDDAAGADLVIEAVFENIDVKRQVFAALEEVVSKTCVLATNTSALRVGDIAEVLKNPGRFCGMHYFSPAEVNPIVEVISATTTSPGTIDTVLPFLTQCRKSPIRCRDHTGFALNRFFCPYTNEATKCLDDGLGTPAQIDRVAKSVFGVPIGPFTVMNIVKPRINLAAIQSLSALGPFYSPSPSMVRCGGADELWDIEETDPPLTAATDTAIADRLAGAVFYAVREALAENVASPEDIDLGARKAFAFTKGPNEIMHEIGNAETQRLIDIVSPVP